jgi:aminoglycoside phosphotransferase
MSHFPSFLNEYLADAILIPVLEGQSGAMVWRVEMAGIARYYLKTSSSSNDTDLRTEAERLAWIAPRFPAPVVAAFGVEANQNYLLTTAVRGISLQEQLSHDNVITIVKNVGSVLRQLHRLAVTDCPFSMQLSQRLALAEARLKAGEVDLDNFDEERQGQSVDVLWAEVLAKRPVREDVVVTHGDFTPANILINPDTLEVAGVIDWGKLGVADRYQDLALMLRELEPEVHSAFLAGYGEVPNLDGKRIAYYQLIDEFF